MTTNSPTQDSQTSPGTKKSFTRHFPTVARVFTGLGFFIFGLNGFLNFIPQPTTPLPDGVVALMGGFMKSGYMLPLIFGTQLVVGVLLLLNCFVPLALALLAPVVVNIFAFHAFLDSSGLPVAVIVAALEIYLAWSYRKAFRPMLAMRVLPN